MKNKQIHTSNKKVQNQLEIDFKFVDMAPKTSDSKLGKLIPFKHTLDRELLESYDRILKSEY